MRKKGVCILLCFPFPACVAETVGNSLMEGDLAFYSSLVLLWILFLLAVVALLAIKLYRCKRRLFRCQEYLARYITENLELRKLVPTYQRPYVLNPPDITPKEFVKIMDNLLKRMLYL